MLRGSVICECSNVSMIVYSSQTSRRQSSLPNHGALPPIGSRPGRRAHGKRPDDYQNGMPSVSTGPFSVCEKCTSLSVEIVPSALRYVQPQPPPTDK